AFLDWKLPSCSKMSRREGAPVTKLQRFRVQNSCRNSRMNTIEATAGLSCSRLTSPKTAAETETRRKKQLRPNPVAPWELRLDRLRVFYSIEKGAKLKVVAVGHKKHNHLFIQGKKVQL